MFFIIKSPKAIRVSDHEKTLIKARPVNSYMVCRFMKFLGGSKGQGVEDKIVNKFKDIAKKSGKKVKATINKQAGTSMVSIVIDPGFKVATVDKVFTKLGLTKTGDVTFGDNSTASVYFMSNGKRAIKAIVWLNGDVTKHICLDVSRSASGGNQGKKKKSEEE